jgi:hypothetical protein
VVTIRIGRIEINAPPLPAPAPAPERAVGLSLEELLRRRQGDA